jgi:hypothetical protein
VDVLAAVSLEVANVLVSVPEDDGMVEVTEDPATSVVVTNEVDSAVLVPGGKSEERPDGMVPLVK